VSIDTPDTLLVRADRLRDQRLWDAAAEAYGAYLEAAPGDWRAMMQHGHAVKEAGDTAGALQLYRAADAIAPGVADTKVQIGGALKRLGDAAGAFAAYADALALDPRNPFAGPELTALAPFADAGPARRRTAGAALLIVFDASDLFAWFRGNRAPTGIQRVQLNIISRALTNPAEGTATAVAAFDTRGGFWREISAALFLRLFRLSRLGADTKDGVWVEAVAEAERQVSEGADFAFAPSACLVNLGTSWWIADYFLRVRHARRRFGIRYIPFIHDCIPLLLPEHCSRPLVLEFAQWFAGVAAHADGFLANSECTAADASRILGGLLPGTALPHAVIRLDAAPDGITAPDAQALPIPDDEPFVLVVGTIEARKNHLLVFQAWLTLLRKHGPSAVPRLVCVGKSGWLAEPALHLLAASPLLADKVTILHGISDLVLATLYRGALFSIYNSFYEGWGLPVTESLGHGRAVVLPRHSALIEAGAEGGIFFEPQSEPDLVAKLEPLIFSPEARDAAEATIARDVHLREWSAITEDVLAAIAGFARADAALPEARLPAPLATAMPLRLLGHAQPEPAMATADLLRDGLGWHALEDWGCWTQPGSARLRLPLATPVAEPLRLYLGLVAPAGRAPVTLRLRARPTEAWASVTLAPGTRQTVFLDIPADTDGALTIEINAATPQPLPGHRRGMAQRMVGIGVTKVMLCRREDLAARIDFLEHQHFAAAAATPGS
jgi:glycosyltransferase involved in cell wall biosynthesis